MSRLKMMGFITLCFALGVSACGPPTPAPAIDASSVVPTWTETPPPLSSATNTATPTLPPGATVFSGSGPLPPSDGIEPCVILATRTPPPDAPTYVPGPTGRTGVVDPHVETCLTASTLDVGDLVILVAEAVDVGMAYYMLTLTDKGMPGASMEVDIRETITFTDRSPTLDFVSAQGDWRQAIFVLRATSAGTVEGTIRASGEIHYGYPGPAMWSGADSDPFTLTVREQTETPPFDPTATDTPTPVTPVTATASPTPSLPGVTPPAASGPFALPEGAELCQITATRTPPPGAPTLWPGDDGSCVGVVDPHVELCASATTLHVGEMVTLVAQPVNLGLPAYRLVVSDAAHPDEPSAALAVASSLEERYGALYVLRAVQPGVVLVAVQASGEVFYSCTGASGWSGGESDAITITVTE